MISFYHSVLEIDDKTRTCLLNCGYESNCVCCAKLLCSSNHFCFSDFLNCLVGRGDIMMDFSSDMDEYL